MAAADVAAPPGLPNPPPAEAFHIDSSCPEAGEGCALKATGDNGEAYLAEMLATMDQQLRCLRESQQRLVSRVELACRTALGKQFGRLVLVGSVALCAETPGSDVDIVCFTLNPEGTPPLIVSETMRRANLRQILAELVTITEGQVIVTPSGIVPAYTMELVEDARVPILRVTWGLFDEVVAVDVLVDQRKPLDHVRWFQAVHACPRPSAPPVSVTPLVTVSMRCVKWWLRQRQIPRTKEGGLPTIAWLLLALHVCQLPETRKEVADKSEMAALACALLRFFRNYSSPGSFHGTLRLTTTEEMQAGDGEKLTSEFRPSPTNKESPWAELVVLDPTQAGEDVNLAPSLSPATQLLFIYELQRAASYLQVPDTSANIPCEGEESSETQDTEMSASPPGKSKRQLEALFEPLSPLKNALPSTAPESFGALLLQGDPSKGVGSIEVAIIERVVPRQGWSAPFLHRSDTSTELHARLYDVSESSGSCLPRKGEGVVVLCPCHFICMLELERDGGRYRLCEQDLDRLRKMQHVLAKLRTHQRALGDVINSPQKRSEKPVMTSGSNSGKRRNRRQRKA